MKRKAHKSSLSLLVWKLVPILFQLKNGQREMQHLNMTKEEPEMAPALGKMSAD
jgi:hypothetical protein